ncbi:DNA/RNA non-specific endonuclease [Phenylobacterium sp.]|uniref:DNA/RNA non-specific endonuclease n=1 Tax=Phenylobacterium sp. TaxID=1871053 RepID=UPI00351E2CB3
MLGVAPRIASASRAPIPRRAALAPPVVKQPDVRYGQPTALGQATRVMATLTEPMLAFGTRADRRQTPPGWQGNGRKFNESRGHLQAKQLGGSGLDPRNLVTLTQKPANSPQMRRFEDGVRRRVQAGEVVEYSATPLYAPGVLPPARILLTAIGSRGAPVARIIENPAGKRR